MLNSFVFIIPLTPRPSLLENRLALRKLCFSTLSSQSYNNWKAILIGKLSEDELINDHFIQIDFEGAKEEKLQLATKYILDNNLKYDYIIRLDDDDVFNPGVLEELKDKTFDLYVDKYHSFWNAATHLVSQKVMYWFPNTCIHKKEHALTAFGNFPPGDYQRFEEKPFLIENEHNDFHFYYNQNHTILFSDKNSPLYLRVLNPDSITSLQSKNYSEYLNQFGLWKKNQFKKFSFLNNIKILNSEKIDTHQNLGTRFKSITSSLIALKNYNKIVINKNDK